MLPLTCFSGVFSAERLAADIVAGIKQWRFFIQTGFDGHLQAILCSGAQS